jgi:BirA family biotin operon repressor/biotin-[acetyl-CoA-carboxylase] ligase
MGPIFKIGPIIMKQDLTETAVRDALKSKWIGGHYQYLESTASTNDLLKEQVAAGSSSDPPAGTVILSDYQAQGRGRLDRRWEAPAGTSLLLSILFRPDWPPIQLHWLTMLAGLAVAKAIEVQTGLSISLKWPNDVVINREGVWQKVCGILLEGHVSAEQRLEYAVLGVGINVNIPAEMLPDTIRPATSLLIATGHAISRLTLLAEILQRLEQNYEMADRGKSPQPMWEQRLMTIGKRVEVNFTGKIDPILGTVEGTGEWGQLLVRDDHGHLHAIAAGDVRLSEVFL